MNVGCCLNIDVYLNIDECRMFLGMFSYRELKLTVVLIFLQGGKPCCNVTMETFCA